MTAEHFVRWALFLIALQASALADEPTMKFQRAQTDREQYILASGPITSSTPKDFQKYLIAEFPTGASVRVGFDSPGGDLDAGLQLGEIIRELDINTQVISVEDINAIAERGYASQSRARCVSACVFAYLGGVKRQVSPGRIGIHRFQLIGDASPADHSVYAQAVMGRLTRFVQKMGADPRLISRMAEVDNNRIYLLNPGETASFKMNNYRGRAWSPWEVLLTDDLVRAESAIRHQDLQLRAILYCSKKQLVLGLEFFGFKDPKMALNADLTVLGKRLKAADVHKSVFKEGSNQLAQTNEAFDRVVYGILLKLDELEDIEDVIQVNQIGGVVDKGKLREIAGYMLQKDCL